MHFSNILATTLLASTAVASPLYARTQLSSAGHLRPKELVTRELEVHDILEHLNAFERRQLLGGLVGGDDGGNSADSPTGSSTSDSFPRRLDVKQRDLKQCDIFIVFDQLR